jgi:hypothetical protein
MDQAKEAKKTLWGIVRHGKVSNACGISALLPLSFFFFF